MEQYRVVDTPQGALTYLLVKKRVKNLNLRLNRQGQAILSGCGSAAASGAGTEDEKPVGKLPLPPGIHYVK